MHCAATAKQHTLTRTHGHTLRDIRYGEKSAQTTSDHKHTQTSPYVPIEWPKSIFIFHKERESTREKKIDFSIKSYNQAIALIDEKTKTTHIRCNTCSHVKDRFFKTHAPATQAKKKPATIAQQRYKQQQQKERKTRKRRRNGKWGKAAVKRQWNREIKTFSTCK